MSSCLTLCHEAGITLCELYVRERELQLAGRENALLELERWKRVKGGHKQVKFQGFFISLPNCIHTHSFYCIQVILKEAATGGREGERGHRELE